MDQASEARIDDGGGSRLTRVLAWLTAGLLAACWLLGGVTTDSTSADEVLQLLALPILVLAVVALLSRPLCGVLRLAVVLALAVVTLPSWQLLPLPFSVGMAGTVRHAISADLATAGVATASVHAALSPFATEHALWSMLPALAMYLSALVLPSHTLRRMLQVILGLVLTSALFAFFQLSLPDGSQLLLFTEWGRNFGGLFANPNHQGDALVIGAVIAIALFLDGRRRARNKEVGNQRFWLYGFICLACVAMVPLANGSASMLLLFVGLGVVTVMLGALSWKSTRRVGMNRLGLAAAALLAIILLASGLALQRADNVRHEIAATTVHVGEQFAPLGTGVGSFVPIYAQYQNLEQARSELINHAHNEYVQWWLEGGVPALLLQAFGLALFMWLGWRVLARMPSRRWRTVAAPAWAALLVLLMHSLVDFPLRTTALMATSGLLAGLLFNVEQVSRRTMRSDPSRAGALQRA